MRTTGGPKPPITRSLRGRPAATAAIRFGPYTIENLGDGHWILAQGSHRDRFGVVRRKHASRHPSLEAAMRAMMDLEAGYMLREARQHVGTLEDVLRRLVHRIEQWQPAG